MPWVPEEWAPRQLPKEEELPVRDIGVSQPAEKTGRMYKLFVGCLPYSKTEADLGPVFAQFGQLVEVVVLKDSSGSSKGAGFVTFEDKASALAAMSCLQGHMLEGATRGMNLSVASSAFGPPAGRAPLASLAPVANVPGDLRALPKWAQPPPPSGPPPLSALRAVASSASPPGSKCFVGQLPYSRSEEDLMQLFSSVGPVVEVCLLKDRKTQEKKGAAFVRYETAQHAAAAAAALDGFLFAGSTRPITVSIAQSDVGCTVPAELGTLAGGGWNRAVRRRLDAPRQALGQGSWSQSPPHSWQAKVLQRGAGPASLALPVQLQLPPAVVATEPGAKLFVGQLPFSKSEEDLRQLFSSYGPVVEVVLHRDAQGQKKGGAFVRYQSPDFAQAALGLDGHLFPGSTRPILVAIAGDKKRRAS